MDPFSGAVIACVFLLALLMVIGTCSHPIDCLYCGQRANEIVSSQDGQQLHCRACGRYEDIA